MTGRIKDALDECLNRLAEGGTVEECLADHPELADELRPLLETAAAVQGQAGGIEPRPEFKLRTRQHLLNIAQARNRAIPVSRWESLASVWTRRWAMAALAVILIILIGGSSTVAASTNAMPDDLLYPVKLAVENVRLSFAGSDIEKAELRADFAERRVEEMEKMAGKGKWGKVEKTAERLSGLLEGIRNMAANRRGQETLEEDDIAGLRQTLAHYATDHPLVFETILEEFPEEEAGHFRNMYGRSRSYYAESIEDVNIAVRRGRGGTDEDVYYVNGVVRMMTDGKWIIGEEVVTIDGDTIINGTPEIGGSASIEAAVQTDGSLLARKIDLADAGSTGSEDNGDGKPPSDTGGTPDMEAPATATPPVSSGTGMKGPASSESGTPRNFSGDVFSIGDRSWVVGERSIIIDEGTVISGDPRLGDSASVSVLVQADGSLLAREIRGTGSGSRTMEGTPSEPTATPRPTSPGQGGAKNGGP